MASSPEAVREVLRSLEYRAGQLEELIRGLRGPIGTGRESLREALDLVESFPSELRRVAGEELQRAPDSQSQLDVLRPLARHLTNVLNFVEEHLAHGTRRELSEALADEVRKELDDLGLSKYQVVLSHGAADNFTTRHGNVRHHLFSPLVVSPLPPSDDDLFALFSVPRLEGARVQWRPVLLGHEVAHVAVGEYAALDSFDLLGKFDFGAAQHIPNPGARVGADPATVAAALYRIAESWAVELLCDAHALRRYGPAAVESMADYFTVIGAENFVSDTHPPGWLRIRILLDQLGSIADARIAGCLQPWADQVPAVNYPEPWRDYLAQLFLAHGAALYATASQFPGPTFDADARAPWVHAIADALNGGIPGPETQPGAHGPEFATDADIVNAVWLARSEGAETPYDQLALKSIENLAVVRRWIGAGGSLPTLKGGTEASGLTPGLLGAREISQRIVETTSGRRLVVAPLLQEPKDSGMDLRLGTRFIVFRRTGIASFDPLDLGDDPRSVQSYIELSPRDQFVLHPQEIVLGATLEYLVMPDDVSGQVITRSSYGRLGLLSATAVQVHGGFRGCLTLELVNLSTIPITLTPSERIAQLVLWQSTPADDQGKKYNYPIGPEFSRVREDSEAELLRKIRG